MVSNAAINPKLKKNRGTLDVVWNYPFCCQVLQINIHTVCVTGFPFTKIPFRRVKEEDIAIDPRLKDNSFEAKVLNLISVITMKLISLKNKTLFLRTLF